ncbi:bifunctional 2-polyprenyl-6-hydroxyphenol methylase/3-demethylubiquinol 3-O-methyltransferase UbiG [Arthrobacter sp. W4I7]|uniref:class I SAM-dependent methyltransferase n=1 Tax=Arthrobacter sp. W4I7 TaxID=3042296 RepID=UPI002785DE62|nr:class I SAM-dependent methyltransferase [Arthrobacter sp. W4I7]MDQ0689248.1 SAM-dependent methyltransferase [Arthrobacter sp. W4I7]
MTEHAAHQQEHQTTHDGGPGLAGHAGSARGEGIGGQGIRDAAALWDERYRSKPQVWSGKPNPQLVREASGLRPGHALDLGCGEGADAIWLAQHGWTVTAVDVSAVALERAHGHEKAALARESVHAAEGAIASRIHWQQADLEQWQPEDSFDLVTSQFLHSQELAWQGPLRAAAAAVRPGGTLLVVGHHPDRLPPWGGAHTHHNMFYTADELVRELELDSPEWQLEVQTSRERPVTGPEGQQATIADVVVRASRIP